MAYFRFSSTALYAYQIKNNITNADGFTSGPFTVWLHDVAHTFWASLLSKQDRLFIFQEYIPALKILLQEAQQYKDDGACEYLNKAIEKAYDFDLSGITKYADKEKRLNKYMATSFNDMAYVDSGIYGDRNKSLADAPIGEHPRDGLYFLLNKFSNDNAIKKLHRDIYSLILNFATIGAEDRRKGPDILRIAARNVAKNSGSLIGNFRKLKVDGVNWNAWAQLLNSDMTSVEIWKKAADWIYCYNDPYKLEEMLEAGFNFNHLIPMTESDRNQFQCFVQNQMNSSVEKSFYTNTIFSLFRRGRTENKFEESVINNSPQLKK